MIRALISLSIWLLVVMIVSYIWYSICLSIVIHKVGGAAWKALIPILNYWELISTLKLPKGWFALSLVPYAGVIYSLAIAQRLGEVYKKSVMFSSTWLTFGAPIGMAMLAFSKQKPDLKVLAQPAPDLVVLKVARQTKKHITKK